MRQLEVETPGVELIDRTARLPHGSGDGGELVRQAEIDLAGEMQDRQSARFFEIAPAPDRIQREPHIERMIIGDADAARTPGGRRRRMAAAEAVDDRDTVIARRQL